MKKPISTNLSERNLTQSFQNIAVTSKSCLEYIFDYGDDAMITTDIHYNIKRWNKSAEKLFGYSQYEVIGKPVSDFLIINDEKRKEFRDHVIQMGYWSDEVEIVNKEGKLLKTILSGRAIKNKKGIITDYFGTIKDATEVVALKQQLTAMNLSLQNQVDEKTIQIKDVLERINDGFASFDADLNFIYVNSYFGKLLHKKVEEIIGTNIKKSFGHLKSVALIEQAFNTQKIIQAEFFSDLFKRYFFVKLYPSPNGVSVYMQDITDRKLQEKETKKQFSIIEYSSAYIGTMGLDGKITYLNKSVREAIEIGENEDVSVIDSAGFSSNKKIHINELVQQVFTNGFWSGENIILSRSGKEIPVLALVRLHKNDKGEPEFISCHATNISELKLKQAESNQFLQIANNSIAYIGIADLNRKVLYFNNAMRKTFEVPANADLSQLRVFDFYSDKGKEKIKSVFSGLHEKNYWMGENEMQTLTGKVIPVIQAIILIRDENGIPQYTSSTAIDISLQKEKQQDAERLANIIDNSLAFTGISDSDGNIVYSNKALKEVFGLNGTNKTVHFTDLYTEKGKAIRANAIKVVKEKNKWAGENEMISLDGRIVPVYQTMLNLKKHNGEIDELSMTAIDITEKKEVEKEMLRLNDELRQLSIHLQNIIEKERENIAKEIHDELSQNLVAVSLNAQWLKHNLENQSSLVRDTLDEQIRIAESVISSSRTLFNSLHPSILDELGLEAAIRWHTKTYLKLANIKFKIESNLNDIKLPDNINLALFRIFQESLTNVVRHSKANEVVVSIHRENKNITMRISDDGVGFDINNVETLHSHGLLGIRERVYAMNAHLNINSAVGKGTTITIHALG